MRERLLLEDAPCCPKGSSLPDALLCSRLWAAPSSPHAMRACCTHNPEDPQVPKFSGPTETHLAALKAAAFPKALSSDSPQSTKCQQVPPLTFPVLGGSGYWWQHLKTELLCGQMDKVLESRETPEGVSGPQPQNSPFFLNLG